MWLLAGQKAPDHSTIARFRTGFLADACENLFYQMVRRLEAAGELSEETVFIDGTKLDFLNGRPFMTGIQQAFREEIITVKQIRMQPLCI